MELRERIVQLKGKKISDDVDTEGGSLDSVLINCEKLNCENKKFRIYQIKDENWNDSYKSDDRKITIKELPNGKKYGEIQLKREKYCRGLKKKKQLVFSFQKRWLQHRLR